MMLGAFKASLSPAGANSFVFGVAAASALWFFGLSAALSLFSARFTDRTLRVINLVCGAVVFFYGAKLLRNFIGLVFGL